MDVPESILNCKDVRLKNLGMQIFQDDDSSDVARGNVLREVLKLEQELITQGKELRLNKEREKWQALLSSSLFSSFFSLPPTPLPSSSSPTGKRARVDPPEHPSGQMAGM